MKYLIVVCLLFGGCQKNTVEITHVDNCAALAEKLGVQYKIRVNRCKLIIDDDNGGTSDYIHHSHTIGAIRGLEISERFKYRPKYIKCMKKCSKDYPEVEDISCYQKCRYRGH